MEGQHGQPLRKRRYSSLDGPGRSNGQALPVAKVTNGSSTDVAVNGPPVIGSRSDGNCVLSENCVTVNFWL